MLIRPCKPPEGKRGTFSVAVDNARKVFLVNLRDRRKFRPRRDSKYEWEEFVKLGPLESLRVERAAANLAERMEADSRKKGQKTDKDNRGANATDSGKKQTTSTRALAQWRTSKPSCVKQGDMLEVVCKTQIHHE